MQNMLNMELETNIISYNTSRLKRIEIINNFKTSNKISILLNIHILDEGIDIPECDSIFVTQPNDNILNLVQRMCRCNRITEYKTKCNMLLWCGERKINKVLNYISDKTNNELNNKIFKFNINNKNNDYEQIKIFKLKNKQINTINTINNIMKITDFLKKYSLIDEHFIDDFYIFFDEGLNEYDYTIDLNNIAKWLDIRKGHLKELLTNNFIENQDYIIQKNISGKGLGTGKNNVKHVLLTYTCSKLLCMISRTKKADLIRKYYIDLEKLIIKYYVVQRNCK